MNIYESRPFKIRNAEEYELSQVIDLFVNPLQDLNNPFEFENNIIKGEMGTGKTMYLKANYAFYLYSLVPSLMSNSEMVLPVFIRLSDFQHLVQPEEIYKAVIIKIIEELSTIYLKLQDTENMIKIHNGFRSIPYQLFEKHKLVKVTKELVKLNAEEYVESYLRKIGLDSTINNDFFKIASKFEKEDALEIKGKKNPGISDISYAYETLLGECKGKVLLLIDEAGSLDKSFFKGNNDKSLFEVLMNQLRTAEFIRTKIAVYPNSYSDILAETRYGDIIMLTDDTFSEDGYIKFRQKSIDLISKYLSNVSEEPMEPSDVFNINESMTTGGDCLEQLIYASNGNLRRMVHLLDLSMVEAYFNHNGTGKVELKHANSALKRFSISMESMYTSLEKEFLENIAKVCRGNKGTYRFKFPYKSPVLSKYISKSEEQNVLKILESAARKSGIVYAFDYSYCVSHEIPTHYVNGSEAIDRNRSLLTGYWITRVANIDESMLEDGYISDKIEGLISLTKNDSAIVSGDDKNEYYLSYENIMTEYQKIPLAIGKRLRFYPAMIEGTKHAVMVEII